MKTAQKYGAPLATLILILTSACTAQKSNRVKVANGLEAQATEFPSVMRINSASSMKASQYGSCTATAVSAKTLLTAAHCLKDQGGGVEEKIWVVGKNGQEILADSNQVYLHPRYSSSGGTMAGSFDIAVVVFSEPVAEHWVAVSPVASSVGEKITLVGFGITKVGGTDSGKKRYGSNSIRALEGQVDAKGTRYAADSIILGDGPRDSADADNKGVGRGEKVSNLQGDSGGPIFYKGHILGVASTVDPKASSLTGTYISAYHHRDWLKGLGVEICGISTECQGLPTSDSEVKNPGGPSKPTVQQGDVSLFAAVTGEDQPSLFVKASVDLESVELCVGTSQKVAEACGERVTTTLENGLFKGVLGAQATDFFVLIKTKSPSSVKNQVVKLARKS